MSAASDGERRIVEANGIRFACLSAGRGPLVLCMHGFPDTAHTWDDLLPRLAAAGYHAVAPNLRGYPPTTAATDGDYSMLALGRDVLALIAALGEARAILVGHDWGALSCYMAANLEPERVSKLVTLAIPHARALKVSWSTLRGLRHFFYFQLPWAARAVRKDDFAFVDELYHRWSPNWTPSEAELADAKATLAEPGALAAALAYYRQFVGGGLSSRQREGRRVLRRSTTVPTLTFAGDADGAVTEEVFVAAAAAFTAGYEVVRVAGAGHFLHRERPLELAEKLLAFLGAPTA